MISNLLTRIWLTIAVLSLAAANAGAQGVSPVGTVDRLVGMADVERNSQPPEPVAQGAEVYREDVMITRAESSLEVALNDGSRFTLDENSRVAIAEYVTDAEPQGVLQLARGRLRSSVSSTFSSRRDSFKVQTKEGVMGVQGTLFDVFTLFDETRLYVFEGVVSAVSRDPAYPQVLTLEAGEYVHFKLGEPIPLPQRFFGFEGPGAVIPGTALGSGGRQGLISGGKQDNDPGLSLPGTPDQAGDPGVTVPPNPNPPNR